MRDWIKRAIKTFIQAFLGVLVPEICIMLQNVELPFDITGAKALLIPLICSAIAGGISAVWNLILQKGNSKAIDEVNE